MQTTAPKVSLENLLDPAFLVLDEIFEPEPVLDEEPRKIMADLHASFQALQMALRDNTGNDHSKILAEISKVIVDATRLAVVFGRHS